MQTTRLNLTSNEVSQIKVATVVTNLILLAVVTGCTPTPSVPSEKSVATSTQAPINSMDVASILSISQDRLNQTRGVVTTASSFNGKTNIKFRLMVKGYPSRKEADRLFNDVLKVIQEAANQGSLWRYYNVHLDIKSYQHGVIYMANKRAGMPMTVQGPASFTDA